VEFAVLGPVEIRTAGQVHDAGHARQRAVLAVLLLDLGRLVPTESLIDRVWGEEPPASVRNVLYGYLARLRAVIARAAGPEVTLARGPGGYLLQARPEQLDLHRFRRLVADAGAAADDDRATAFLRSALGLWLEAPLAGVDSPWLRRMRDTLELERVAAVLDLNDIGLRQGQHSALIGELAGQAAAYPADERLIGQLMLALYRSGRQAEALRWFEKTGTYLAEELGASPGPELQALHQRMLRADSALALRGTCAGGSGPVPRQLPADVPAFTGRAAELAELDRLLPAPAAERAAGAGAGMTAQPTAEPGPSTAAAISVVAGTAGVGKTGLAVHWAHLAAGRFPDGQLYVDLRGYDPGAPVTASDALAGFLRALGVDGQDIPADAAERAARYRSLLAGKPVLVLLDNVRSPEQVRPLLPGSPACAVIVTSRDALAGLVAREGARRVDLDLLPSADAVALLRAIIGDRVSASPGAAAAFAERCCRLPLALRVAAELAVARPGVPLADLASELADQRRRLDLLDADGDPRTAVRTVFSWSYQNLGADAARMFRVLGLHTGPDFDPYAAAALAGSSPDRARELLTDLARAHLVQPAGPGRHALHELLSAYARELAAATDGGPDGRAAVTRLLDYYLHTAAAAMDAVFPAEATRRPSMPQTAAPAAAVSAPAVSAPEAARSWLDAERANLVAAIAHACGQGWPVHGIGLAGTVFRYLDAGGYCAEAIAIHSCARDAAGQVGDRAAEAAALMRLATVNLRQARYQQAWHYLSDAVDRFEQTGDRTGQARALVNLGIAAERLGRYQDACSLCQRALGLLRRTGDRTGQATALGNLGLVEMLLGRHRQAADRIREALALCRECGDRYGEARALTNLGAIDGRLGRCEQATGRLREALALCGEIGDRTGEADALVQLAAVDLRLGRCEQAAAGLVDALTRYREMGDSAGQADALNHLGEVFLGLGQPGRARAQHAAALDLAIQIGDRQQQARAHHGLGDAHGSSDPGKAREHWREALSRYADLGLPEADEVRARLSRAPGNGCSGPARPSRAEDHAPRPEPRGERPARPVPASGTGPA
jgi:DNA-binding SARP family transcriptional activator/Tfp pilus assembly protein PilF